LQLNKLFGNILLLLYCCGEPLMGATEFRRNLVGLGLGNPRSPEGHEIKLPLCYHT